MHCAEGARRTRRFPLEVRAARTPGAPALLWRDDPAHPQASPDGNGSARSLASPYGNEFALPPTSPFGKGGSRGFVATRTPHALSFSELDQHTRAIALALPALGIARGERVGLRLAPGPAYPMLLLALVRAGCVAAPLSTRVPASAIPGLLRRIGCSRLIAETCGEPVAAPGLEVVDPAELIGRDSAVGRESTARLLAGAQLPFDRCADATIVFTSGSSGAPKAALHSFENHWASAVGANRNLPLRPGDRWLLSLPLWHVGGLAVVFRCLQAGAAVAVAGPAQPLAEAILDFGVTHLSLVATQLFRLLRDPRGREALRSTRAVLLGGGPVPFPLIAEADRLGVRLVGSYGSTETASQATATRPGESVEHLHAAGRALPFREIAIAPDGEILARGRTLFRGYVDAAGTHDARDGDGWFRTGDLGHRDVHGQLVIDGRRDAMFISGGENIHPGQIEREILRFPGVLAAIVVPVPDPEFGARPAAFLCTADGALPDAEALRTFLRATLPGFTVPVKFLPWPELVEGVKPDRRALAALAGHEPGAETPETGRLLKRVQLQGLRKPEELRRPGARRSDEG